MRKKTGKLGILAAIGMASALIAACGSKNGSDNFNPEDNIASTLYGPEYNTGDNFNPADNEPYEVYGPAPEDTQEPEDTQDVSSGAGISWTLDTSGNSRGQDVSSNLREAEPDGDFKPSDNVAEPVYGPPAGTEEATE